MAHALSRALFRSASGQNLTVSNVSYTLGGKIGDGAVGIVRKATRNSDHAEVAIKFLARSKVHRRIGI